MKAQKKTVNHPAHYNTGRIEVIEAIEDWKLGFCLGNIARADYKGSAVEDLKKARWYLDREIRRREGRAQQAEVVTTNDRTGGVPCPA